MTKTPTTKDYEKLAEQRIATKPVPLGTAPKPPTLAKPLKKGGK